MNGIQPTEEQEKAIAAFALGENLTVQARAGTGKSTTLEMVARSTQRTGTYLAFNRALVDEASEKMPMNTACMTTHGLAMRAVGREFRHRLDSPRMKSYQVARILGLGPLVVSGPFGRKVLQPSYLASLTMRAIRVFCQSDDPVPSTRHVPYVDGIDERVGGQRGWANNDLLRAEIEPALHLAWADMSKTDGSLSYSHDAYLKTFERQEPRVPGDFVLADELQDFSGVQLSILEQSMEATGQQVVAVGDTCQQLYAWRGSIDALQRFRTDRTLYLTMSYRFGEPIAEVANLVLAKLGATPGVVGHSDLVSSVGEAVKPAAVLCRSNAEAVRTVLNYQKQGVAVHLVGGAKDVVAFARAAWALQRGEKTSHPDLACFDTWDEVKSYVAEDALGDDLRLMVRLLEEFGIQIILDALGGMIGERDAEVIVSTAHAGKGRGFRSVRLAADFPNPGDRGEGADEEWRLLYVAVTRAKELLDVRSCEPIMELMTGQPLRRSC